MDKITDYGVYNEPPYVLAEFLGTNLISVLQAADAQFNEIETAFYDLLTETTLANAVGVQLDVIGKEIGLLRDGRDDAAYRIAIGIQIAVNLTPGIPEVFYTVLRDLLATTNARLGFYYPAKVWVDQDSSLTFYDLFTALSPLTPSGVGLGIQGYLMDTYGDNIVDNNGNTIICTLWGIPSTPMVPGGLTEVLLETSGGDLIQTQWGQQIAAWQ